MNKSKLYFQTAILAFFLTFTTGLGIFVSIILLFFIRSEERKLFLNLDESSAKMDLKNLEMAKIFSFVNLVINLIIIVLVVVMIYIPGESFTH